MRFACAGNPASLPQAPAHPGAGRLDTLFIDSTLRSPAARLLDSHLLLRGQVIATDPGSDEPIRVRCLTGEVWITQAGDPRDHILLGGQAWRTARPGRVVIEAVSQTAQIILD